MLSCNLISLPVAKEDNDVVCLLGALPLDSPLKITELTFIAGDTAQQGSITLRYAYWLFFKVVAA